MTIFHSKRSIKVGSDFSGVGAFDYAVNRVASERGLKVENVFACDMDKYARQSYIENHGRPNYYPENVYDRAVPEESLDIYMTSPPCQAFSIAGNRKGKDDDRGILFFNSHKFIKENKPRFFIFENVEGLLSDDGGKTFSEWINMLGGKSVNGMPIIFPYENSVPYHVYWSVLNTKEHGVPQNRKRVFIIGIRDDQDNNFQFPKTEPLIKKLKDVLEEDIDDKYFLSEKMTEDIVYNGKKTGVIADLNKGGQKGEVFSEDSSHISCLSATDYKQPKQVQVGTLRTHKDGKGFRMIQDGNCPTIPARAREDGSGQPVVCIPTYGDKRLNDTLSQNSLEEGEVKAIDIYNRKVQDTAPTLTLPHHNTTRLWDGYKIRRLTPRECFRLQDFPDTFKFVVSDTQLYKQAGNSITVRVLEKIISKLNL